MSGRWAFQETSALALPFLEPTATGALFDLAASLDDPAELATLASRLRVGLARPGGFVAHVRLPLDVQRRFPVARPRRRGRHARALLSAPFCVWIGFGARHASAQIAELVARTGAGVVCTPRAKGVFPENHPRFAGVTGFGGHDTVKAYLEAEQPQRMLDLGKRLGEFS
jgi:acetolactate synthase-1/2/3 large subunit